MATATVQSAGQTPLEEMAERASETIPGLYVAAGAVGLEDHRRMLAEHARRVRSDYNRLNKVAGGDVDQGGDDMGNITITGDINVADTKQINRVLDQLGKAGSNGQTQPAAVQPSAPPPPSAWSKAWPWVLAGAAGLAGAGIPTAISALRPDPTPVAPVVEMPKYDVEKWTPPK